MKPATALVVALVAIGSASAARLVAVDRSKLRDWTQALGVTSLLEQQSQVQTRGVDSLLAATPEDVEAGDFEIQCRTDCDFVKHDATDFETGGKAALIAANDLALSQAALKTVIDRQNVDPESEELQMEREKLELEVREKTHKLQVAAGAAVPDISAELVASSLEVVKSRLHKVNEALEKSPEDPGLLAEQDKLTRAIVAKKGALKQAASDVQHDASVKAEADMLQDKLEQLKGALGQNPESAQLRKEIEEVESQLQSKAAKVATVVPKRECYRVCASTPDAADAAGRRLLAQDADIDGCVRMCVKVMRQLVYGMAQRFL